MKNVANFHRVPVSDAAISMRHNVRLEVLSWYLMFSIIYELYINTSIISMLLIKYILNECIFKMTTTSKEYPNMSNIYSTAVSFIDVNTAFELFFTLVGRSF